MDSKANETIDREYEEALSFLFSQLPMFSRVGAAAYKPGLDTSIAIDNAFGNPHKQFKSIHIAGTNGKGSTSHLLAAILQAQGYKTALYTSPHLVDFRERMRVDGKMIPKEDVIEFVRRWRESESQLHPSFFELTMMMAFDWFAKQHVDYAVIEVGMGGRLDSTNIITPQMCVITNISTDHTQFLGDTLPKIASEKAGIIKEGIPVIIGEAEGEIRKVFADKAASCGAPATFAEDCPRLDSIVENPDGGWDCTSKEGEFRLPLAGDYQKKNINTVLNAVDGLRKSGMEISDESVTGGIENVEALTGLMGRWTKMQDSPLVIADTGHNIAGVSYNMGQLRRIMESRKGATLRIVIGFVADKDIDKILGLLPKNAVYYITNAQIPRALPAVELKKKFIEAGLDGETFDSVSQAYSKASCDADENDVIFIGGSTFIVADFLAWSKQ